MASEQELSVFLRSVEKRAFKRAHFATHSPDSALDIVQDAMIRLAGSYGAREASEWPMLFQRILTNAILDWHRRQKVRASWMSNMSDFRGSDEDSEVDFDLLESLAVDDASGQSEAADRRLERMQTLEMLDQEIARLPERQREAFLLRYWEGLDVAETAQAMGCTEGSVKTHCSRATQSLAKALRARGLDHDNR
ncbi:RNA polymerase sigma factor [Thiomonas sp. FB-6]|uniref:RNA polymerase sigma factor n=1 Tax=Thiomonas sp. FB-6 TaxID=1158291 RepID=UPI0004768EC6|nr:RNA polymerase sigma factor [Thiomonas sp. FB-6]